MSAASSARVLWFIAAILFAVSSVLFFAQAAQPHTATTTCTSHGKAVTCVSK